jgi:hypothetical protein
VRAVDCAADGMVATLAGSADLFGFGSKDGLGRDARFQHPLGITLVGSGGDAYLVVADTYNQVLRRVDPLSGAVTTLSGTGKAEAGSPERIGYYEPGGISAGDDRLYVADTNHHRIVMLDLPGLSAHVLQLVLPGAPPAAPQGAQAPAPRP